MKFQPKHTDPALAQDASGGVLFGNLHHGLLRVSAKGDVLPGLAKHCHWQGALLLRCTLKPNIRFNNGSPITAHHFVRTIERLKKIESPHLARLQHLKTQSGVVAVSNQVLEWRFQTPDPEFRERLASPIFSPRFDEEGSASSGPYQIAKWERDERIELEPNPHFAGASLRPKVHIFIIDEDATAMNLFDLGKLHLLRQIPALEFAKRKTQKGFHFVKLLRFDHIGFGPDLKDDLDARKALSLALNTRELTKLFQTPGQVGCPGLGRPWLEPWPCVRFAPDEALSHRQKSPTLKRSPLAMRLSYSKGSGDDTTKAMEWMQEEWRKRLGLAIEVEPLEYGVFLDRLKTNPPALYRRAVTLDRPSCTAALEGFLPDHPDNTLGWRNEGFRALLQEALATSDASLKRRLCGRATKRLIDDAVLVPMGEISIALQSQGAFAGWFLNPLGHLDLTGLRSTRPQSR